VGSKILVSFLVTTVFGNTGLTRISFPNPQHLANDAREKMLGAAKTHKWRYSLRMMMVLVILVE